MPVKRYLAPSDFTAAETWRLVEWCRKLGADEFTIDSVGPDGVIPEKVWRRFTKVVKPYSRGAKTRERMSGRTADELTRSTQLWELNDHTLRALGQALPGGLLHYEPKEGGWFEDPILYREGRLMLGTLSHEAFAVVCLSEAESAQLAAAGFPSHDALPRIS
ncbi:MAG: hypothetical protein M3P12_09570 [Gemmatimonadota bacterium]|nr:hypothetical protein [Gemmatimonadota bacterium]